jgi:ABC-type sugar transport system permease subunit
VLTGTRDGQVNLLSSEGQRLWTAQLEQDVVSLALNRNGAKVVVAALDGTVTLINGANTETIWQTNLPRRVRCTAQHRANCLNVAISGDATRILVGTRKGDLYILDGDSGAVLQRHRVQGSVSATAIALDGEAWLSGTVEGVVHVSTFTTSGLAYQAALSQRRNTLIGIMVALIALITGVVVWVRTSTLGLKTWRFVWQPLSQLGRDMWSSRISYILLLPTLVLLAIFNYYPAGSGLFHTFTDWNPGLETTWVGFEQIRKMFASPYFWVGMKNALILVIAAVVKLIFPLIVAELIFHVRNSKLQYGLRSLFVIPLVLPSVVGILLWVNIYDPNIGLLNETLELLGLEQLQRVWLGDRDTAMAALVAIGFPWVNPFALLIFYGGLISIPTDLFDAARVDGASWWTRILRIDLPMLMSQLKLLLILAFIGSVQEFQLIFLTTEGGPGNATYTPALELYYNATRFTDFGLASAMGTFLFLIIMIGTILNLRYVRSQTEYQS